MVTYNGKQSYLITEIHIIVIIRNQAGQKDILIKLMYKLCIKQTMSVDDKIPQIIRLQPTCHVMIVSCWWEHRIATWTNECLEIIFNGKSNIIHYTMMMTTIFTIHDYSKYWAWVFLLSYDFVRQASIMTMT